VHGQVCGAVGHIQVSKEQKDPNSLSLFSPLVCPCCQKCVSGFSPSLAAILSTAAISARLIQPGANEKLKCLESGGSFSLHAQNDNKIQDFYFVLLK